MEIASIVFMIVLGGIILIFGGELLVRGASRMALIFRVPPLVVGLTVVAFCTSAPELTVSLLSCFKENGSPELAVGNVVGSNTFNILGVLGIAALFRPIAVSASLIRREIPLMIFVSVLFWFFGFVSTDADGLHSIPRWGGVVFVAMLVAYMFWTIVEIRRKENKNVANEMETDVSNPEATPQGVKSFCSALAIFVLGLGMLIGGSDMFINGAVRVAQKFGVSQLTIGLTILAVGTSLPEMVVSVVSVIRGKFDLAIGNAVGSSIFNILGVLGLTTVLVPGGIAVSRQAFYLDIPIMILVACVGSFLCITGSRLSRCEGLVLVLGYLAYLVYLLNIG